MNSTNITEGQTVRFDYVESALGMVKDCQSGLQSRMLYCILSHVVGSVSGILMPLLIVIGTIGNAIVAHVMLTRLKPLTRQNLYLGCIAIADILRLLFLAVFHGFLPKGLPWLTGGRMAFILYNIGDSWCKMSRYGMNFFHALTALWLLVLVSDRILVVHKPLMMKQRGTRWAAGALLAALLLAIVNALPNWFLIGHVYLPMPAKTVLIYCYRLPDSPRLFMMFYTIALSNPPTLVILAMVVLDLMLMKKVAAAIRERRRLQAGQKIIHDRNGTVVALILAVTYLVLHLPQLGFRMLVEISLDQLDVAQNLDYLAMQANLLYAGSLIALVNQCVSFFVLFSRSASFKRSTLGLCCCSFVLRQFH